MSLQEHFAPHMPLLVTEFGVPSSLGSAHNGPTAGTRARTPSRRRWRWTPT